MMALNNEVDFGIIICGSGNGANMTANKHQKIRSALCWNKEIAELSRTHNNANVLSIPSRFVSLKDAKEMVKVFTGLVNFYLLHISIGLLNYINFVGF